MIRFSPNCTFPTASEGFVDGPPIRGTMSIVWSCLSIIFLCTWSVLHLKVPPQHRPATARQRLRWRLFLLGRKLKWMAVTVLAPEVLMGSAFTNFWSARKNGKQLKVLADEDGVPWSATHTFFANQGGFLLHFSNKLSRPVDETASVAVRSPKPRAPEGDGLLQESSVDAGRLSSEPGGVPSQADEEAAGGDPLDAPNRTSSESLLEPHDTEIELRVVNASGAVGPTKPFKSASDLLLKERLELKMSRREQAIRRYGPLQAIPLARFNFYSAGFDVKDDNEVADTVTDLLYDTWALDSVQLIYARECGILERLPSLEEAEIQDRNKGDAVVKLIAIVQASWMVAQLASRAAYGVPSTLLEVTTVAFAACSLVIYLMHWSNLKDLTVPVRLEAARLPTKTEFADFVRKYCRPLFASGTPGAPALRNDADRQWVDSEYLSNFVSVSAAAGVLFGSVHLLAWGFAFPTEVERALWRASALALVLIPLAFVLSGLLLDQITVGVVVSLLVLCSVVARAFLLVESFRSLYFLPPDAYVATWTRNAPHLA